MRINERTIAANLHYKLHHTFLARIMPCPLQGPKVRVPEQEKQVPPMYRVHIPRDRTTRQKRKKFRRSSDVILADLTRIIATREFKFPRSSPMLFPGSHQKPTENRWSPELNHEGPQPCDDQAYQLLRRNLLAKNNHSQYRDPDQHGAVDHTRFGSG